MATHSVHRHLKRQKKTKKKSEIDRLVYFAVVIGPALTIPQVYSIWMEGSKGVSIISWLGYLTASLIWLVYGLKHRERPIVIVEIVWIILASLIIAGLLRK